MKMIKMEANKRGKERKSQRKMERKTERQTDRKTGYRKKKAMTDRNWCKRNLNFLNWAGIVSCAINPAKTLTIIIKFGRLLSLLL